MTQSETPPLETAGARFRTPRKKKPKPRSPFKMQRYGGWLPYVWHGMRFGDWVKLLLRGRFDITLNCLPYILTTTLVTPLNSALYYVSEWLYRRRAESLALDGEQPVFVVGHWRTGTTLLHDLLASDPAFAFPTTYECAMPNHFLLTEGVLDRALGPFLPARRPQDDVPVGFDRPQEEEFAYAILGMGTPYSTMAWPRHGPADTDYLDLEGLAPEEKRRWSLGCLWLYRRLALRHGRPLVLKSPPHTGRVKLLLHHFPRARFVHIARDPLAVVPSTIRLWEALYSSQGLHNPPRMQDWIEAYVLDAFERLEERYAADRALIPDGQLAEIRYEELVADPKGVMRRVYGSLGLGPFARAEPYVDAYLADRRQHRVTVHDLAADRRQRIETRLAAYRRRFGYAK